MKNELTPVDKPTDVTELSLGEQDSPERQSALSGKRITFLYTVVSVCCVSAIGICAAAEQTGIGRPEQQNAEQICLYYDGEIPGQSLMATTVPPQTDPIPKLDIAVAENRENELVFDISIKDYIDSFNSIYFRETGRNFLAEASQWQRFPCDSAIHSPCETDCYYFREDENVYNEPTISVYVPSNGDYIQEITINFDEHGYTESGFAQYKQLCYCTMKVFFPDLEDTEIQELCTQIITLGNQNVFDSDAWYSSASVPYALFCKDGIGVYPYFATGDWEHFCVIPVTENTIQTFEEKGVLIYEIE